MGPGIVIRSARAHIVVLLAAAISLVAGGGAAAAPSPASDTTTTVGEEKMSLRSRFSKTFSTDEPQVYRTRWFSTPVHYRDKQDQWREIDHRLMGSGQDRWANAANDFGLSVARDFQDSALARLSDGDASLSFSLDGARPGSASPDANAPNVVIYRGILPQVDVRLISRATGIKEQLVLRSAQAPSEFLFPLHLEGLTAELRSDGGISYRDTEGEIQFTTPPGWMVDSSGPDGQEGELSRSVDYRLADHDGQPALQLKLDREWLNSPDRVFPVIVDPTVLHSGHEPIFYVDTYYEEDVTWAAYSGSSVLRTGRSLSNKYRAFLQFGADGPGPGVMTPGSGAHDIQDAFFGAYNYSASNCSHEVYAKRTLDSWRHNPDFWAQYFGPSYSATDSATAYSDGCGSGWVNYDVTSMVRNWESDAWDNHGIALVASHNFTDSFRAFYSQDYYDPAFHPYMDVDWYNTPPYDPFAPLPADGGELTSPPAELSATYQDADGDRGWNIFTLRRRNPDGDTEIIISNGQGSVTSDCCGDSAYGLSPTSITSGLYKWQVRSTDGTDVSNWSPSSGDYTFRMPSWWPTDGRFYYDGKLYAQTYLEWDHPGAFESGHPGYEQDIDLNPNYVSECMATTTLPDGYDDCPTAGVSDPPDEWGFGFGSLHAQKIDADHTYFGSWDFTRSPEASSSTVMDLRGQEVENGCPLDVHNIWCYQGVGGQSADFFADRRLYWGVSRSWEWER